VRQKALALNRAVQRGWNAGQRWQSGASKRGSVGSADAGTPVPPMNNRQNRGSIPKKQNLLLDHTSTVGHRFRKFAFRSRLVARAARHRSQSCHSLTVVVHTLWVGHWELTSSKQGSPGSRKRFRNDLSFSCNRLASTRVACHVATENRTTQRGWMASTGAIRAFLHFST
jgi:hypothetical protein